jgi:hypothetical protein
MSTAASRNAGQFQSDVLVHVEELRALASKERGHLAPPQCGRWVQSGA